LPCTIEDMGSLAALPYPNQRKIVKAQGLWWIFYSDGANIVYRTSGDGGKTWSAKTTIKSGVSQAGSQISVCLHGNNIHIVWVGAVGVDMLYRMGLLGSDGTISWKPDGNGDWKVAVAAGNQWYKPTIAVDSSGRPWMGYSELVTGVDLKAWVTTSTATDGTWVTRSGYPWQPVSTYLLKGWSVTIVALTNNRMYVEWTDAGVPFAGKLYDGSAWGSQEAVTTSNNNICFGHSLAAIGDDVHLAFETATTNEIRYVKRTYGSGWGSEVYLATMSTGSQFPTLTVEPTSGIMLIMWQDNPIDKGIFGRGWNGYRWSPPFQVWLEDEDVVDQVITSCQIMSSDKKTALAWVIGSTFDYHVRFAEVDYESTYLVSSLDEYGEDIVLSKKQTLEAYQVPTWATRSVDEDGDFAFLQIFTRTKTVNCNTWLKAIISKTINGAAWIPAVTKTVSGNANLKATQTVARSGNAYVKASTSKTVSGNATIKSPRTSSVTGNSFLKSAPSKTRDGNAVLKATRTSTLSGQACLKTTQSKTVDGNANIYVLSFTLKTVSGNARLKTATSKVISGNATITIPGTGKSLAGNAYVKAVQSKTRDGNAQLKTTQSKTLNGNAAVTVPGTAKMVSGDAHVTAVTSKAVSGNAVLKITVSKTVSGDAELKESMTTKTISGSAYLAGSEPDVFELNLIGEKGVIDLIGEKGAFIFA